MARTFRKPLFYSLKNGKGKELQYFFTYRGLDRHKHNIVVGSHRWPYLYMWDRDETALQIRDIRNSGGSVEREVWSE